MSNLKFFRHAACLTAIVLLMPLKASAEDYGWSWPLALSRDDGGAYRVVLTPDVYTHTTRADLKDLDVRNGAGLTVPAAVLDPEEPLAASAQRVELPIFDLPADYKHHHYWKVSRETRTRGQIERSESVHTHSSSGPSVGILMDASRVREPIQAIDLQWEPLPAGDPLDIAVTVETSADLTEWTTVLERGQLVDLENNGQRVLQNRLTIRGANRYLRILPVQPARAPNFTSAQAILQPQQSEAIWQWQTLSGTKSDNNGQTFVEFESPGRFPIARADLVHNTNSAAEWRLESRDSTDATWTHRAGPWIGFQVHGDVASRSSPQSLNARTRDRYWRLVSTTQSRQIPELKLGYRPEVLVFLAQEEGPFTVVAGSTKTMRTDAPLDRLVQTLRQHFGAQWSPLPAYLGPIEELSGAKATAPVPKSTDWGIQLLWGILIFGTVVVAGIAIHLLKSSSSNKDEAQP